MTKNTAEAQNALSLSRAVPSVDAMFFLAAGVVATGIVLAIVIR